MDEKQLAEMDHDLNTDPVGMDKAYPENRGFRHGCIARKLLVEVRRQREEIARLEAEVKRLGERCAICAYYRYRWEDFHCLATGEHMPLPEDGLCYWPRSAKRRFEVRKEKASGDD